MEKKIQFFSKKTNKFYQLFPTKTIPALKISGVPMHRFVRVDPLTDTLSKIKALKPEGIMLDSCTGLGYTAIFSSRLKEVKKIFSFEKDKEVLKIASMNEASKELFENEKIILKNADVSKEIKKFSDNFFDSILHDPPTFKISPELYSEDFIRELFRVLKKGRMLWFYCPNPGKMKGENFKENLKKKLKKFFYNIKYDENSLGFLCKKD